MYAPRIDMEGRDETLALERLSQYFNVVAHGCGSPQFQERTSLA